MSELSTSSVMVFPVSVLTKICIIIRCRWRCELDGICACCSPASLSATRGKGRGTGTHNQKSSEETVLAAQIHGFCLRLRLSFLQLEHGHDQALKGWNRSGALLLLAVGLRLKQASSASETHCRFRSALFSVEELPRWDHRASKAHCRSFACFELRSLVFWTRSG